MKKNRLMSIVQCGLLSASLGVASLASAQTTNWVAFYDHARGTGTGANSLAFTLAATAGATGGGLFTNDLPDVTVPVGGTLPVGLAATSTAGANGATGGSTAPNTSTPADLLFAGHIAWLDSAYYFGPSPYTAAVIYNFTNLTAGKRYVFRGSAIRGNGYADRWSAAFIQGVDSAVPAHIRGGGTTASPGIVTNGWAPYGDNLPADRAAAWDSGENRGGDVIGWDAIVPTGNSFSIICSNFRSVTTTAPTAAGGTVTLASTYAYSFAAMMLAELESAASPAGISVQPQSETVVQGLAVSISVTATGSPAPTYQWYKGTIASHTPVNGATSRTLTFPSAQLSDAGSYFVVCQNSLNTATSGVVTLTVIADTEPPRMVRCVATPANDGFGSYFFTVSFSEAVDAGSAENTAHYSIETPDGATAYYPSSGVMSGTTNVVLLSSDPFVDGYQNFVVKHLCGDPGVCADAVKDIVGNPLADGAAVPVYWNLPLIPAPQYDQTMWDWDDPLSPGYDGTPWATFGDTSTTWKQGQQLFAGDTGTAQDYGAATDFGQSTLRTTTVLAPNANSGTGPWTTYYRRHFFMPPASSDSLTLNMRQTLDDGALFFVNGQEILRYGIGAGVNVVYNTPATSATETANVHPVVANNNLPTSALVLNGDNAFAVEVHSVNQTSTDVLMGVELMAYITNFASGPAKITVQPTNTTVTEGQAFTLNAAASGALPLSFQWYHGATAIEGATSSSYHVAAANPTDAGNYHITVNNPFGTDSSTTVHVTVNADTTAPAIVSALGSRWAADGASNITVTFSEALEPASVTTGAFAVNDVAVLGVAIQSPTVVVVTTDARTVGVDYTLAVNGVTDTSFGKNPVHASVPVVAAFDVIQIDDPNQVWSFNDLGGNLGSTWYQNNYIGQWPTGLAVFDSKSGSTTNRNPLDGQTVRQQLSLLYVTPDPFTSNVLTYYFQTTFNWPGTTNVATLQMHRILDDGAIFYVNGVEFYATNMPAARPVNFETQASAAAGNSLMTPPVTLPGNTMVVSNLVNGQNVLSVEVHQSGLTSSDVTFGMNLLALVPSWGTPAVAKPKLSIVLVGGQVQVSWGSTDGTLMESDSPAGPWTSVGTANPYSTAASGAGKFYKLSK